ncbi:MAG: DMT family transporter [Candidatus Bathyarchaeia archaeon]
MHILNKSHVVLMIANVGFSFILIFSTLLRDSGISSFQQVLFRLTLAILIVLALNKCQIRIRKDDLRHFMVRGISFSLFLLTALSSIALGCSVPVATALIHTQPLFTSVIAMISGRERVSIKKFPPILMGIVGVFIVGGIDLRNFSLASFGVPLAIIAGFLYAIYLFMKRVEKEYRPLQALFNTFIFAAPFTLFFWPILRAFIKNPLITGLMVPNYYQFFLLFLLASVSTVVPYGLLNYVKNYEVSPTAEGVMLLIDPAFSLFWAMLILGQYATPFQYFGVVLILTSALIVLRS